MNSSHMFFIRQTFTANVNENDVKQINFPRRVVARYLRVVATSYWWHVAMRMEVLGYRCEE